MRRFFTSMALVAVCLAMTADSSAQSILWDQQPDTSLTTVINLDVPAPADVFSTYLVNDATFTSNVNISTVATYITDNTGTYANLITNGVLNIFDGNGLVAGDDPTSGGDFGPGSINVSAVELGNNVLAVIASDLNINLAAGTYFFGLAPSLNSASDQQEFHFDSGPAVGSATFARNPGGGFGLPAGTDWFDADGLQPGFSEAAFTVLGEEVVPEPTTTGFLALGMIGLVSRRR